MAAALLHRVLAIFVGLGELLVAHPILGPIYLVTFGSLGLLTMWFVWRGEPRRAFWCAIATVLVDFLFSWGDDTFTHIYRITALAEQVRHGALSQFLVNPTTGETLPVFVYYNALPYVIPTVLNLAGVPAFYAFKLVMCGHFVVMALGLQALIARSAAVDASPPRQRDIDQLVAFLFVTANYVYCLWCTRGALAELWVYCLVPWVVNAALTPRGERSTTVLLFLQICGHPIVLLQSLIAEAVVAFSLSKMGPIELLRRGIVPAVVAVLLSAPFWLPQFLWQDWILGPKGLPVPFSNSFLTFLEVINPRNTRTIGVWIPLALLLLIVVAQARLSVRVWTSIAACLAIVALQTVYLYGLALRIPTLELSLFVWRLAFPAAFLGFGALLAGWREVSWPPRRGLAPIAILSTVCMMLVVFDVEPYHIATLSKGMDDQRALVDYDRGRGIWGVHEFFPNYARTPRVCDGVQDAQVATFDELRAGLKAAGPVLVVHRAPVGLVDYRVNGAAAQPGTCEADLVLGSLPSGALVTVSETWVDRLLWLRILGFVAALLIAWRIIPFNRLRPATQGCDVR